ncbi:MAG: sugar nucleotide-binding protein [Eubacteriales bacterium]
MKTALVGSSGYIAEFILKRFAEESEIESILKLDRNTASDAYLDLAEAERFEYSRLDNIDYVVFTAAVSGPDKCAQEFNECWKINVTGTSYFIREAIKRGCRVLFFSSDAAFGDIPGAIYDEESTTAAETPYGKMKKAVEDEFKGNPLFKAIRLSYVASAKDRFYTYCLNCIRNNETADIFHPFYRNVIAVSDVVEIVTYFAFHWEEYTPTFLNVAGKELVSRVRMADELNRHFEGKLKYTISMPGEEFFKNRPRITQMKSLYMQNYGIVPDNTFTEKIAKELEEVNL